MTKITNIEKKQAEIDAELILKVTSLLKRIENTISLGKAAEKEYTHKVKTSIDLSVGFVSKTFYWQLILIENVYEDLEKKVPRDILQILALDVAKATGILWEVLEDLENLFQNATILANEITRSLGDLRHAELFKS